MTNHNTEIKRNCLTFCVKNRLDSIIPITTVSIIPITTVTGVVCVTVLLPLCKERQESLPFCHKEKLLTWVII